MRGATEGALMTGEGGVLWITGYSGAGKTTIGRKVEARLREQGRATVFLDGDDLRRILAGRWGYERSERLELSKVYFRLCSHLASQGVTVVIAAIAMYEEVYEWMRANIPHAYQVYLRVPEGERRRRDSNGKRVYQQASPPTGVYDEPRNANLVVDNHGAINPDDVARRVAEAYLQDLAGAGGTADHGKHAHWEAFYRKADSVQPPSSFAIEVARSVLGAAARVADIGCGDGRDSAYLRHLGHQVIGVDTAQAAVDFCRRVHAGLGIEFRHGDIRCLEAGPPLDAVYCRFAVHAMTRQEERDLIAGAHALLRTDGALLIECRSVNDPMLRLGEVISPTERIHGHYRRFIVIDELIASLQSAGFRIEKAVESRGLSALGDDDPAVIRVVARK